jgi:bacteriocin-like protein
MDYKNHHPANRELTDDELNLVTGGDFFDGHVRTNGEDPLFRIFMLAAKATFYEGMWYSGYGVKM